MRLALAYLLAMRMPLTWLMKAFQSGNANAIDLAEENIPDRPDGWVEKIKIKSADILQLLN
jgi:hypothetical protein